MRRHNKVVYQVSFIPEQLKMLDELVASRCARERRAVTRSEVIREAIDMLIREEQMRGEGE